MVSKLRTLIIIVKSILFEKKEQQTFHFTKDIFVGKKYNIGDYTYGSPRVRFENPDANLTIGKYCSIADNVNIFLGGNHRIDWITTFPFSDIPLQEFEKFRTLEGHPATKGNVEIGNDVWIGSNVIIFSGVKIGNGAVIAAGAVISKNIGAYEVWGGNPAKLIKKRFSEKEIDDLEKIKWWDWEFQKVTSEVRSLCSNSIKEFIEKHLPRNENT